MEYENRYMMFPRKGYGRIFVEKYEDIQKIEDIIKEVDEYEYQYMPEDLITVFGSAYEARYTHKFCDMDMTKVLKIAWERGIKCFVVFGKITGYEE